MKNLHEMTAHELSTLIKSRQVSAVEATRAYLDRIQNVEDKVESLVTITEEKALRSAEEVDKKIAAGENAGPLAGVPFIAKDNICTKDIETTCSSKMLYNFKPPYNATVIEKLDAENGVLIGKANMDEFAMGGSTETSYFKKTKNPHNLSRVPGGSSGGSAASIAADEAAYSLGSDTGGSIRQPASFCGVVGFKPTYGTVSRFGLVAFASSLDQIGPITKDVTDCAYVLNAITGHDAKDSTSVKTDKTDFTKALNADVRGMKIGIPKEYMSDAINPEIRETVMKAAKQYEAMGAEVSECSLPTMPYALAAYYLISSAEASSNLARYDGVRYGFRAKDCDKLEDLYLKTRSQGFGDEVKRRIMLGTFVLSSGYYDAYYKRAQQVRTLIKRDFDKVFEKYDFLISPVSPITAWELGNNNMSVMEVYAADICTVSINIAGLPGMSIPCGADSMGLPIGVQLIGKPFGDAKLVQGGYALEQSGIFPKIKASLGGVQ